MRSVSDAVWMADANEAAREGRLYRLVDPSESPDWALSGGARQRATLIRHPLLAQTPAQRLYLERMDQRRAAALASQLDHQRAERGAGLLGPVPLCGWLISHHASTSIATYLGRQLKQMTPEGKPALLRFYDPRVLEHLPRILERWQLSALLGPIDRWVYLDTEMKLRALDPHGEVRRLGGLKPSAEQWRAIQRIGQINRCRELYRTLPGSAGLSAAPANSVDALLVAAHDLGLRDRADVATFVLHGLITRIDFHRHPIMQTLLGRLGGRLNYIGLSNQLSDADWEAISNMGEMT
ncbi:DUF4123 domain-containing protein [Salinicola sp. JS01]|uniref:DUF4123 domain-containing protein n=1 Tax=Salinicola sp. JS01 TaxID=3050071 RepID=UPI00255B5B93|nr:DUF4123 domain-containing protein [Salinicola sp. JS01]WIX34210.1 DUF4123 domain-containing protein [Salinicola sp. JS01]